MTRHHGRLVVIDGGGQRRPDASAERRAEKILMRWALVLLIALLGTSAWLFWKVITNG